MEMPTVNTTLKGERAEDVACNYLISNGFVVRHRNWRKGHKELDIVAQKDNHLHFVEVRSRTQPALIEPAQTIDRKKQRYLLSAARAYIGRYCLDMEAQFDVIAILFGPQGPEGLNFDLEYIPDAFSPI